MNARVDAGIAPLVEALSEYANIRTLESCEGAEDPAYIIFDSGDEDWESLSRFVFEVLGPSLMAEFGERVSLNVGIAESGVYRAEMTVNKIDIPAVSRAVRELTTRAQAA